MSEPKAPTLRNFIRLTTEEVTPEDVINVTQAARAELAPYIRTTPLPEEVAGDAKFIGFFHTGAKEFAMQKPNQAIDTPFQSDEERMAYIYREMATSIANRVTLDELKALHPDSVRNVISHLIREHIDNQRHDLFNAAFIYTGPDRRISPKELKLTVLKIKDLVERGQLSKENAIIAVLFEIGVLTPEEIIERCQRTDNHIVIPHIQTLVDEFQRTGVKRSTDLERYNTAPLREEVARSLNFGRQFIEQMAKQINTLVAKQAAKGKISGVVPRLSVNQEIRDMDAFELLEFFFCEKDTKYQRQLNDTHLILTRSFTHLLHWRRMRRVLSEETRQSLDRDLISSSFSGQFIKVAIPILAYDSEGKFYFDTGALHKETCRILKKDAPGISTEDKTVNLLEVGVKGEVARVHKQHGDKHPDLTPENLSDEARTRLVTAKRTSREIKSRPELKQYYLEVLRQQGIDLGLTEVFLSKKEDIKNPNAKLRNGTFYVKDDYSRDDYPKLVLHCRTHEGLNFEVQLIAVDTFQFEEADQSPSGHSTFSAMRNLKMGLQALPYTHFPIIHNVIKDRLKELDEIRDDGTKARKAFLDAKYQTDEPHSEPNAPAAR